MSALARGNDAALVELPKDVWSQGSRPMQGRLLRWTLAGVIISFGFVFTNLPIRLGGVALGFAVFFGLFPIVDGRLEALAQELGKATKGEAGKLISGLEQRWIVSRFAPHVWVSAQKGRLNLIKGDTRAAAAAFAEAARQSGDPNQPHLVGAQAHALALSGDPKGARSLLVGMEERDQLRPLDAFNLGVAYVEEPGKTSRAVELLESARKELGASLRTDAALALAYARDGKVDEAASLLEDLDESAYEGDDASRALYKRARRSLRQAESKNKGGKKAAVAAEPADEKGGKKGRGKRDRRKERREKRKHKGGKKGRDKTESAADEETVKAAAAAAAKAEAEREAAVAKAEAERDAAVAKAEAEAKAAEEAARVQAELAAKEAAQIEAEKAAAEAAAKAEAEQAAEEAARVAAEEERAEAEAEKAKAEAAAREAEEAKAKAEAEAKAAEEAAARAAEEAKAKAEAEARAAEEAAARAAEEAAAKAEADRVAAEREARARAVAETLARSAEEDAEAEARAKEEAEAAARAAAQRALEKAQAKAAEESKAEKPLFGSDSQPIFIPPPVPAFGTTNGSKPNAPSIPAAPKVAAPKVAAPPVTSAEPAKPAIETDGWDDLLGDD